MGDDATWRGPSYADLADSVLRMVTVVRDHGLAGRRVGMVPGAPAEFITQLFALMAAGATCVPLPPQTPLDDPVEYRARVAGLIGRARPHAIVTPGGDDAAGGPALRLPELDELSGVATCDVIDLGPDHLALIQFSSGTSGAQRAVRVSRGALEAQLAAIAEWCRVEGKTGAHWLPFHHDMGLIGTTMTGIVAQQELMLMTPLQYLTKPAEWLRCFGMHGATIGAAPGFGYAHASQKVTKEELEGCDFSGWHMAIVGAEPIRAAVLERFIDLLGPFGFTGTAFCPAYGLAEGTLAVTGVGIDEEPGVLPDGWHPDAPAPGREPVFKVREETLHPLQLVGSGRPLQGVELSIRDFEGGAVKDGSLGEIWVGGTSLADGYEPPEPESWPPGWFRTGDIGCVVQGQLFVFGRLSDSFQVAGEIILAEQAEQRIQARVPEASILVVVPSRSEGAGVTVVAEGGRRWTDETAEHIRRAIADLFKGIETDLVVLERGAIPRTTSGKPQRRECWRRFVAAG